MLYLPGKMDVSIRSAVDRKCHVGTTVCVAEAKQKDSSKIEAGSI